MFWNFVPLHPLFYFLKLKYYEKDFTFTHVNVSIGLTQLYPGTQLLQMQVYPFLMWI